MQLFWSDLQAVFKRLDVAVVLPEGILELVGVPVDFLGPGRLFFPGEDPAFHVLGFDHENPVAGHDHMVDLGGAVFNRQSHVFDQVILLFVQHDPSEGVDDELSDPAFEKAGFEKGEDQHDWDDIDENAFKKPDGHRSQVHSRIPLIRSSKGSCFTNQSHSV